MKQTKRDLTEQAARLSDARRVSGNSVAMILLNRWKNRAELNARDYRLV